MHLQIIFVFAVCSKLFFWTNGAPAGDSMTVDPVQYRARVMYSKEETDFILNEALSQAQTNKKISWKKLATEHKRKVQAKAFGFKRERSAENIRHHFERTKHALTTAIPKKFSHSHRYTKQEEDFINKELLNESIRFCSLYSDKVWKPILEKHNLEREAKREGFSRVRSSGGLCYHFFNNMRPGQRISKEVLAQFPRYFVSGEGTSSQEENSHEVIDLHPDTVTSEDVTQDSGENDELFDFIMTDLDNIQDSVDEEGIDHRLFVEKGSSSTSSADWKKGL